MPSQKLIRRQSFIQRLSSYPQDLLLSLNETYELLEWDSISDTFSIPIGVALNVIYLLTRLDQHDHMSSYQAKDIFEGSRMHDSDGLFGGQSGGVHTLLHLISWSLVGFSIANAFSCFTKRKNYRMFDAKPNMEPVTPNARRVTVDSPVTYSPGFFSSFSFLRQSFRPSTPSFSEDGGKKQAWELSIWDPSKFSLNAFCWFSPLHILIIEYLAHTSVFATFFLLLLNTIQLSLLINFATTQQKDKTTLYTQVLSEYNTKFIEPRISVRKRDIGTSTPTTTSPDNSPRGLADVEIAPSTYGATGASLESFRRKYGPVERTPLRKSHSVSVGTDAFTTPAMNNVSRPSKQFDLWNAGGTDFPSPNKIQVPKIRQESPVRAMFLPSLFKLSFRSKSSSTPAFARPVSRGPTFVNNSPVKGMNRKRRSGGDDTGETIPGIRRW